MAFNLIDSVKGLFGSEFLGTASSMLGETDGGLQKAMGGIIPSVLAGVMRKAASGDSGGILNMAKDAAGSGILGSLGSLGNISGLLGGDGGLLSGFSGLAAGSNSLLRKGIEMLRALFGDKTGNVTSSIARYSGVTESSALSLMSIVAPAALGLIGRQAQDTNMSSSGLLSFLNEQKDPIMNAMPFGLNLAGALGLSSLGTIGTKLTIVLSNSAGGARNISGTRKKSIHIANQEVPKKNWSWPVLLTLAGIMLIWLLVRGL
jgi:hypothetical protein